MPEMINPDTAVRCDCRWDFETRTQKTSFVPEVRGRQLKLWYLKGPSVGWKFGVLGAVSGYVLTNPRVNPLGPEAFGLLSEEEFIKILVAFVSGAIFLTAGFLMGRY
jgi:hypothetical protein